MPNRPPRGEGVTRQRILEAAIKRFGAHAYEDTSLRDIAQDVGVDVAYVHRSFGSKEKLFLEALGSASEEINLDDVKSDEIPAYLVRRLFVEPRGRLLPEISSFDILVRSASSPQVSSFLSKRIQDEYIYPLARKLGDADGARVFMTMSLLMGFGVLRDFLQVPEMATANSERAQLILSQAIQLIVNNLGIPPGKDL